MNRDQIVQALMFYAPEATWSFESNSSEESISYESIVWTDLFYPKPTQEELQKYYNDSAVAYASDNFYKNVRRQAYPSVEEQLDTIFHHGVDEWKRRIQNIKDSITKPDNT